MLAGHLPDAIFAADLWDVISGRAHDDYRDPVRFFGGTYPTANLKLLVKDVAERLAGLEGGTPVYRLETGFGGGKTHSLIAAVHVAREGGDLASLLGDYSVSTLPGRGETAVAAFVGEESDPLNGNEHRVNQEALRTYTPWGQIALLSGGIDGYHVVRENDLEGIAPSRADFEAALGDRPVLILIDELVLYMARAFALREDHPRSRVNSQWPTFLQMLFSVAARRARTAVILTLPSEQDANRKLVGELRQYIPTVLDTVDELDQTAGRQARNLTPTQANERAAVLGRRLFMSIDHSGADEVARAFVEYYDEQRQAGVQIDGRAFESGYADQIRAGYPFHPELIRLFAERLADIPEFQATRGALRLVARAIRAAWDRRHELGPTPLLQPQHLDLTRAELRDEILARLGRGAFERGLDADVVRAGGGTHASEAETGWPWPAATESALVTFLHSLPDGSRGITAPEAALAIGRPGRDLAYVARALEETERRAWYMRHEGQHYLFRTRASINKRFQERLIEIQRQPGEVKEVLDGWVQGVYSGFEHFLIIPFPADHTSIPDIPDRIRLVIVHYDTETGAVGGGDRLSFTRGLFTTTGVNATPRRYRNNVLFLLAESTRINGLKEAVRALIAWERVAKDIELEQANLAQAHGSDYRTLKALAERGATGVPAEFVALEHDLGEVRERLGTQELNVRSRLLDAYRVLAFPQGNAGEQAALFTGGEGSPLLECFRVEFGETPEPTGRGRRSIRQAVAEGPILQCLRQNQKLVPEASETSQVVLAAAIVRRPPLWQSGERRISTEEVWDRLRREPELPLVLRPTDLLPTFRAGLTAEPDPLWTYYNQVEKRVFTRETADSLAPILAPGHLLYEPSAAVADRIYPVASVKPQEVWDHLWPREGSERATSVLAATLLETAQASAHFPVLPEQVVLWQALQEGVRENRWLLYLPGPRLAIGATELMEWPGTPRFDDQTELWTYQAALDRGMYPRQAGGERPAQPSLTAENLRTHCWSGGSGSLSTEELERSARGIWPDLSRPRLEQVVREGLELGVWGVWKQGADETFFSQDDAPAPTPAVGPSWLLVDPASTLRQELEPLRPGRGPQPITQAGTPREALTGIWEELNRYRDVELVELTLTVADRDTYDNTLLATWADRPRQAQAHTTVVASGQRDSGGKQELVDLRFEGRFEEVRAMLAPIWPFASQGELDVTIAVRLSFEPSLGLANEALESYRAALMNANQGTLEARIVPLRVRRLAGAP